MEGPICAPQSYLQGQGLGWPRGCRVLSPKQTVSRCVHHLRLEPTICCPWMCDWRVERTLSTKGRRSRPSHPT